MGLVTSLYVHIPFCSMRCAYCDFFSSTDQLSRAPEYVDAVLAEFEASHKLLGPLGSIYLGGGTPTLLGADLLTRLLAGFGRYRLDTTEVSVEANPSTVTEMLAASLRRAGANRVTLGVQSFDDSLRRNLGRAGSGAGAVEALRRLRAAGFNNIGLDLIFGIPGQDAPMLEHDLEQALLLEPEHISCYELSYERGGSYHQRWMQALKLLEPQLAGFYETVVGRLQEAGYRWYETSNYAQPGRECRHNLAYWCGEDFLGLGAGAWSTVGHIRWRNTENLERYIAENVDWNDTREVEHLSCKQKLWEAVMMGLRMKSGLSMEKVQSVINKQVLSELAHDGYLTVSDGTVVLTTKGFLVVNDICTRILL